VGLAGASSAAQAQPTFSLSATSDYLYRGYSLSAERPALVASAGVDHASGLYASASAIAAATRHDGVRLSGYQLYAGYARRFDADSSWEVGAARTKVTEHYRPRYPVEYNEFYAGVATRRFSAHVYYSPNYLGEHARTLYATTAATLAPAPGWKAFARAGVLVPVDRRRTSDLRRSQFDAAAGLARRLGDLELQGQISLFGPDDDLLGEPQGRAAASVSATFFF
jgi:uncharacterized protein (TIGR02001 family)